MDHLDGKNIIDLAAQKTYIDIDHISLAHIIISADLFQEGISRKYDIHILKQCLKHQKLSIGKFYKMSVILNFMPWDTECKLLPCKNALILL